MERAAVGYLAKPSVGAAALSMWIVCALDVGAGGWVCVWARARVDSYLCVCTQ